MNIRRILLPLTLALNASCASMEPQYGCPAPDGISCMSISEVADRDEQGLPMRRRMPPDAGGVNGIDETIENTGMDTTPVASSHAAALESRASSLTLPDALDPGDPIYREPLRLRIWVVDWQDRDRVYHPNHYLYLQVDPGEWVIPRMRERLEETAW